MIVPALVVVSLPAHEMLGMLASTSWGVTVLLEALTVLVITSIALSKYYWHQPCHLKPGLYCATDPAAQAIKRSAQGLWGLVLSYRPAAYLWSADLTTTFPFLCFNTKRVEYTRKWVLNPKDRECVAVDLAFPAEGFDSEKPLVVVLHGLNGGSNEGYVTDCASAALGRGWSVAVFIARGLGGTELQSSSGFSGARISDLHQVVHQISI